MNELTIKNRDNSFILHFSNFKYNINYVIFEFECKSSIFKALTTTTAWIEEINMFEEDLKLMSEKKKKIIDFSPLGEFWTIKFLLHGDCIDVKGDISDLEENQSNLVFHNVLSVNDLMESLNSINYSSDQ